MNRYILAIAVLILVLLPACTGTPAAPQATIPESTLQTTAPPVTSPPETTPPETTRPPLNGWQQLSGQQYYYEDGIPHTGWLDLEGTRYYFSPNGVLHLGWLDLEEGRYYLTTQGPATSWQQIDGTTHYFNIDGTLASGWIDADGLRYYLDDDGTPTTGWLHTAEGTYYFCPDGTMARGQVETDRGTRYFTSTGKEVILVNPWNQVPQDYSPTIVDYAGWQVDASCRDALAQMLSDCEKAGHTAIVVSAYRTHEYQTGLFQRRIQRFMDEGYDREEAERLAAMRVARPGTSEHELGLAVDIVDAGYQNLNEKQETMPAQIWLMDNSWRYGFILRYPNDMSDETGIIYEPWHYRYVGTELAAELHATGQCLEVYLASLTDP